MYYRDRKVVITVTAEEPITDIPERTITLDYGKVRIPVGRSSSKVASVTPKEDNAFFDNPVMSRSHAELYADLRYLRVYIRDTRSSHGTLVNGVRIEPAVQHPLKDGDVVTFGVAIRTGADVIQPIRAKVGLKFLKFKVPGEKIRGTFMVPDDDSADEIEEATDLVGRAIGIMQRCGIGSSPVIDLTMESVPLPVTEPSPTDGAGREIDLETSKAFTQEVVNEGPAERTEQFREEVLEDEPPQVPETQTSSEDLPTETFGDSVITESLDEGDTELAFDVQSNFDAEAEIDPELGVIDEDGDSPVSGTTSDLLIDADATLVEMEGPGEPNLEESPSSPVEASRKRKADEISTDDTEDVEVPLLPYSELPPTSREAIVPILLDDESEYESRPAKRLQTTAGKVGFAALGGLVGGLAIFTTLVASGPTFS